ncbi:NAD(P)H-hydrate dehydratase [Curvibacter sp. RS43]|uniref:NAD(P)H-hydrate dehydratase n=1 Tax=Curvibacter microcysteis TaxID=3026419 RepID=UPI00235F5D74|nr:NAD(P)H-hydrate dehydratase [Curvibacter sp. RS43]MDD0809050.1 NAD(P)H-hydrate dehydratase [Curvibacter sp. RS43]
MQRIRPDQAHALHSVASTRALERRWLAALPPHTLMQRAGLAAARLAQAIAPHAAQIWVACGAGNNGGDGLEAAAQLKGLGYPVSASWLGQPKQASTDTLNSLHRALAAGVPLLAQPPTLQAGDLAIDALLGIGLQPSPARDPAHDSDPRLSAWIQHLNDSPATVLALDLPSGLSADQGVPVLASGQVRAQHTLSLLSLKPGLFTAQGRDLCGQVWLDGLDLPAHEQPADAWLSGPPHAPRRTHSSHKGSFGDVLVLGGESLSRRGLGMTGAALLAARAALHAGAGRVLVALLDEADHALTLDPLQPELMLRRPEAMTLTQATVVCGCGGGEAVRTWLPRVLSEAPQLVLDADALNHIAAEADLQAQLQARASRHLPTVLTPHPLEAARLLGQDTTTVQSNRQHAAQTLAQRFGVVVVLKGSGTVVAAPGQTPHINPTGNARLASGGTGDVLAGLLGALWAAQPDAHTTLAGFQAACSAVYLHGQVADHWEGTHSLTASHLAAALRPINTGF